MITEDLIPTVASVSGGFFIGVVLGYFVKKIIKVLMFIVGGIVGLLLYLQQLKVISVHIENLESSSIFVLNSVASSIDKTNQIGDANFLGVPLVGGLSAGFAVGFLKG